MRFTQAYAASPVCTPSRVGFMTGRYPARTQVGLWEPLRGLEADRRVGLSADHPTVSSLLAEGGYETALVGKWHLGFLPEYHPTRHGFGEFFGIRGGAADYISHLSPLHQSDLFQNTETVDRDGYLTHLLTDRAVAFISRAHTRPFFISVQYTAPHWPWQAPGDEPYAVPAETGSAGRAPHASNKSHQPGTPMTAGGSPATYAAMMKALDDGIAEILAALDRHGLAANTLVIFTSDNGGERFSDMGPFSGRKMELREGGIRVPALLRWPRVLEAGREIPQAAITMDWSATILAAARVRPHAAFPLDGIDLLPICRGEAPLQPRTFAWRTFQQTRHRALRHGDWKYLHDGEREYLFDLAGDPSEERDPRPEHPERFEDLRRRLIAWEAQMLPPVPLGGAPDQSSHPSSRSGRTPDNQ